MEYNILILLIVFQIKHLIADYYFQFPYMYENKGKETGWFKPLFDHALVHAAGTLFILGAYNLIRCPDDTNIITLLMPFFLSAFDLVTHFITDRWKATRGRSPNESKFWTDLGIDQMIHHIVGILIIWSITC
jgi:hypothetical protein